MVRKTSFLLLVMGMALTLSVSAQTVQWLVKPNYDAISHLNNSIYKCKINGKTQLVDTKGKELLDSPTDSVTDFSGGFAFVLAKTSERFRIHGIIDETGTFKQVHGDYYANQYSHFSEQLASVSNPLGKSGYIDTDGKLAIPCQYKVARPFVCGWASVEPSKKKQQTRYINHHQKTLKVHDFHGGKVIMGSSFNERGRAMVAYYGNDNAIIDTTGKVVGEYKKQEDIIPIRDYDFAFDEAAQNNEPPTKQTITFDPNIMPYTKVDLVGFQNGSHVIAPQQFTWAERLANECAIVQKEGKYGIVKLIEGSFGGTFEGDDLIVASGKSLPNYTYTLAIPQSLAPASLQTMFDIGDGNMQRVEMQGNTYLFTPFVDADADVCMMKMQVYSEGLLLWEDSLERSVVSVSLDISSPMALSERADDQDNFRIQSVITNNSDSPVNVTGAFSISLAKGSKNKVGQKRSFWGKIAPKGKMEVFVDLNVIEEENAKVTISVKVNKKAIGSKTANIPLKPFY